MIDESKKLNRQKQKERIRRRMQASVDPDNYEYIPEIKPADFYNTDVRMRVAIYVRVSTDDVRQTTSYELQKNYYEDYVIRHPNWELVEIYADEGISGTSRKHRDAFNRMIADAHSGKIDLIVTKSVSRFARNIVICIGLVRELAELKHPVGIYFESEAIYSLNDDSQMALSFLATMAEEESHTRSRSMETSLRMRLDNGIPLTPKLLGYTHDTDGNLIINPEEAPTVKLAFYMYLYGYSTQQIADTLIALGRRSYLGNIKWTSGSVVQILRNERHCGEVLTRKTFTPNYHDHLSRKNRGERPQSRYFNHHEAIISRDDFIAVQRMLDNAKYGNKSILPELRVIESGILKGYVSVNPRWSGFKEKDYYLASQSAYKHEDQNDSVHGEDRELHFSVSEGDLDLRGFEVARVGLFDSACRPAITFADKKMSISMECVRKFSSQPYAELLVNPILKKLAIRPTGKENRNSISFIKVVDGISTSKYVPITAFNDTLYALFGWNTDWKCRVIGSLFEKDGEIAYIFDAVNTEVFFKSYVLPSQITTRQELSPISMRNGKVKVIPEEWTKSFGRPYYAHEQSLAALELQSEDEWLLRMEGQLFESGKKINVTDYNTIHDYIRQELSSISMEDTYE